MRANAGTRESPDWRHNFVRHEENDALHWSTSLFIEAGCAKCPFLKLSAGRPVRAAKRAATASLFSSVRSNAHFTNHDYNHEMDGTDRADAMQHPITIARKTFVWHRKLGLFIAQRMGVLNGFILARQFLSQLMKNKTFAKFTLNVARKLTAITSSARLYRQASNNHNLEKIPSVSQSRPRPTKQCAQCKKINPTERAKDTRYQCSVCVLSNGSHVPLHLGQCFETWHKSWMFTVQLCLTIRQRSLTAWFVSPATVTARELHVALSKSACISDNFSGVITLLYEWNFIAINKNCNNFVVFFIKRSLKGAGFERLFVDILPSLKG